MGSIKGVMDRETAESYVLYGLRMTKFTKRFCKIYLVLDIIMLAFSLVINHGTVNTIFVAIFILIAIIISIVFLLKWSAFSNMILEGTYFFISAIAMDLIFFNMTIYINIFAWYEYLITVLTQLVAIMVCFPITINFAEKHSKIKNLEGPKIAQKFWTSVGIFVSGAVPLFCKLFLNDAPVTIVWPIIGFIIDLSICSLGILYIKAFYRAYLIKKFHLLIDIN